MAVRCRNPPYIKESFSIARSVSLSTGSWFHMCSHNTFQTISLLIFDLWERMAIYHDIIFNISQTKAKWKFRCLFNNKLLHTVMKDRFYSTCIGYLLLLYLAICRISTLKESVFQFDEKYLKLTFKTYFHRHFSGHTNLFISICHLDFNIRGRTLSYFELSYNTILFSKIYSNLLIYFTIELTIVNDIQENEKSNTKEFAQINVGQITLWTPQRILSKTFKGFL